MSSEKKFRIQNGLDVAGEVLVNGINIVGADGVLNQASYQTAVQAMIDATVAQGVDQNSIDTAVSTAVAALADSAPETLNTLNELAAALGDDADFATSMTNALNTKLTAANNLSDVADAAAARSNLGLGTAATAATTSFATAAQGVKADSAAQQADLDALAASINVGTRDFTVNGAITAGQPVTLLPNGDVTFVAASTINETNVNIQNRSATTMPLIANANDQMPLIHVSGDMYVTAWKDHNYSIRVGTQTATSDDLIWNDYPGTEMYSGNGTEPLALVWNSYTNMGAVIYREGWQTTQAYVRTFTISGTTVVAGTQHTLPSSTKIYNGVGMTATPDGSIVGVYAGTAGNNNTTIFVLDSTGALSYTQTIGFNASLQMHNAGIVYDEEYNVLQILLVRGTGTQRGALFTVDWNNGQPDLNASSVNNSPYGGVISNIFGYGWNSTHNKSMFLIWNDSGGYAAVFSVDETGNTFTDEAFVNRAFPQSPLGKSKFWINYDGTFSVRHSEDENGTQTAAGGWSTFNVAENHTSNPGVPISEFFSTVTVPIANTLGTGSYHFRAAPNPNGGLVATFYVGDNNNGAAGFSTSDVEVIIESVITPSASNFVGISNATVTSATAEIVIAGGLSTNHTGLSVGSSYYVQSDGSLSTTTSSVKAGTAIDATTILVSDHLSDSTDLSDYATKAYADSAVAGVDLTNYTNTVNMNTAISTAVSDISSSDLDMGGNKVLFGNVYSNLADLPDASTYHGMFAHVHATGKGYFAHAGNWVELANSSDLLTQSDIDTAVSNLVDSAPEALNTLNELAAALGDDANFASTVTTSLAAKADDAATTAALATKADASAVATSAQGALADTSIQPEDLTTGFGTNTVTVPNFGGSYTNNGTVIPDWGDTNNSAWSGYGFNSIRSNSTYYLVLAYWNSYNPYTQHFKLKLLRHSDDTIIATIDIEDMRQIAMNETHFAVAESTGVRVFDMTGTLVNTITDTGGNPIATNRGMALLDDNSILLGDGEHNSRGWIWVMNYLTGAFIGVIQLPVIDYGNNISEVTMIAISPDQTTAYIGDWRGGSSNRIGRVFVADLATRQVTHTIENPVQTQEEDFGKSIAVNSEYLVVGRNNRGGQNNAHRGAIEVFNVSDYSHVTTLYHNENHIQGVEYGISTTTSHKLAIAQDSNYVFASIYSGGSFEDDIKVTNLDTLESFFLETNQPQNRGLNGPSVIIHGSDVIAFGNGRVIRFTANEGTTTVSYVVDDSLFATKAYVDSGVAGVDLSAYSTTAALTSNDLDMGGNKVLFGNVYSNLADLPSATTYHGMFAHVHATGKGYFAHAGNWVELANSSDLLTQSDIDTAVANLVDSAPEALNTLNELAAALGDDANFASTMTTSLASKADSTALDAAVADIATNTTALATKATSAQGALADTAVQPEDFSTGISTLNTTTADWSDNTWTPSFTSLSGTFGTQPPIVKTSPNGNVVGLFTSNNGTRSRAIAWDSSGAEIFNKEFEASVNTDPNYKHADADISNTHVVIAAAAHGVEVYDLSDTSSPIFSVDSVGAQMKMMDVFFSGNYVVHTYETGSGLYANGIKVYDWTTGALVSTFSDGGTKKLGGVVDGYAYVSVNNGVKKVSITDGSSTDFLDGNNNQHQQEGSNLVVSSDYVVTSGGVNKSVFVYDIANATLLKTITNPGGSGNTMMFGGDQSSGYRLADMALKGDTLAVTWNPDAASGHGVYIFDIPSLSTTHSANNYSQLVLSPTQNNQVCLKVSITDNQDLVLGFGNQGNDNNNPFGTPEVSITPGPVSTVTTFEVDDTVFATKAYVDSGVAGVDLSGYTTTADLTSNDLDLNGNKVLFGNVYSTLADLPSATTYHGMFAHVHATGKGYFAHAGNWVELANTSDLLTQSDIDTAVANLVDAAPDSLNTLNELAAALGDDANFASTVTTSLASKADASALADKADVTYVNSEIAGLNATIANINVTGDITSALDSYSTTAQMNTAISTAVDGLVDSAPGALDTLNELAAALGDDANFASTVTTNLAAKADANAVATLAQGALADTALQPADLGTGFGTNTTTAYDWTVPSISTHDFNNADFQAVLDDGANLSAWAGGNITSVNNESFSVSASVNWMAPGNDASRWGNTSHTKGSYQGLVVVYNDQGHIIDWIPQPSSSGHIGGWGQRVAINPNESDNTLVVYRKNSYNTQGELYVYTLDSYGATYQTNFTIDTRAWNNGGYGDVDTIAVDDNYIYVGHAYYRSSSVDNMGIVVVYDHNGSFVRTVTNTEVNKNFGKYIFTDSGKVYVLESTESQYATTYEPKLYRFDSGMSTEETTWDLGNGQIWGLPGTIIFNNTLQKFYFTNRDGNGTANTWYSVEEFDLSTGTFTNSFNLPSGSRTANTYFGQRILVDLNTDTLVVYEQNSNGANGTYGQSDFQQIGNTLHFFNTSDSSYIGQISHDVMQTAYDNGVIFGGDTAGAAIMGSNVFNGAAFVDGAIVVTLNSGVRGNNVASFKVTASLNTTTNYVVDLSAYSTTAQMNTAIAAGVAGVDLSGYSTTVQMNTAITTAADAAQATAIATASSDATTKANAAEAAAIASASVTSTTKADAAQAAAIAAAATDATTKADAAQAAAIAAAATDATTKANAAQSAAETFATNAATTAVANVIDTAPDSLNTLNELAAALGDDANFASTVTAALADKADSTTVSSVSAVANSALQPADAAGLSVDDADKLDGEHGTHYRINIYDVNGTLVN